MKDDSETTPLIFSFSMKAGFLSPCLLAWRTPICSLAFSQRRGESKRVGRSIRRSRSRRRVERGRAPIAGPSELTSRLGLCVSGNPTVRRRRLGRDNPQPWDTGLPVRPASRGPEKPRCPGAGWAPAAPWGHSVRKTKEGNATVSKPESFRSTPGAF